MIVPMSKIDLMECLHKKKKEVCPNRQHFQTSIWKTYELCQINIMNVDM